MEMYCSATGLPFSEQILTWESKTFPVWAEFQYYQIWHGPVMASTGFVKNVSKESEVTLSDLPPHVNHAIRSALPFYKQLYSARFMLN